MTLFRSLSIIGVTALAACGGDPKSAAKSSADSSMAAAAFEFKAQKKFIDSVIKSAPKVAEVAKAKGTMYDVADDALTAAVKSESMKTRDCYTNALRDYDSKLTGVATILVNFGGAGWDLVRVEDSKWSTQAGGAVVTCINARAKKEWKLPTKGIKFGAHLVQLTFRPDSATAPAK